VILRVAFILLWPLAVHSQVLIANVLIYVLAYFNFYSISYLECLQANICRCRSLLDENLYMVLKDYSLRDLRYFSLN